MTQDSPDQVETPALPKELDRAGWLSLLQKMGEDAGYFKTLNDHHWATFNEDDDTLLVSFDRLEDIRANPPGTMPPSFGIAIRNGWSHLSLICEGASWYRDRSVYDYFDALVDEAFFEGFERVVFYGADMGGYAACAFSVAAPGATVVAIQPRATLDPEIAIWDRRDLSARRLNFRDRYAYAPDMTEGAKQVFLIHDPMQNEDAAHAALFRQPHVTRLNTRFFGATVAASLSQMKILDKILQTAMAGTLTPPEFYQLLRARRRDLSYLRGALRTCIRKGQPQRQAMICRSVTKRLRAPGFRRHLADLVQKGLIAPDTAE